MNQDTFSLVDKQNESRH